MVLSECTTAQELKVQSQSNTFLNTGPIVTIQCVATFPMGSTQRTVTLLFNHTELAVNRNRKSISLRHIFTYYQASENPSSFTLQLNINNAVKQDEGLYECQMNYLQGGNNYNISDTAYVTIYQYLPASNYPECSIEPTNVFVDGGLATFTCIVGDSKPDVDLELKFIKTDGFEYQIGDASFSGNGSITFVVNTNDNITRLVCYMTSDTFPTVYRRCYVGLIVDVQSQPSSTAEFQTTEDLQNEITTPSESQSTASEDISTSPSSVGKPQTVSAGIKGGAAGGGLILLLLLFVIICIVIRKKSKSKTNNLTSGSDQGMDNVYLSKTDNDTDGYEPPPAQPATNLGNGDYAYADVQNTSISAQSKPNSSDTYDYAEVAPSKLGGASNFPIYSQVNKSFKRDESKNEAGENEDSGMVENIVYVSAGPK